MAKSRKMPPAMTPEARENEMISLAMDQAERQLREGTASSQVLTHFLKLATAKEQLEKAKLEKEVKMIEAKTEALKSAKSMEEMVRNAMAALSSYNGFSSDSDDAETDDYYD